MNIILTRVKWDPLCSIPPASVYSWTLIRAILHDWQFKIILIYLLLGLVTAPQFSHCLKQAVLDHLPLGPPFKPTLFGLAAPHRRSEHQVVSVLLTRALCLGLLY